MLTDKQFDMLLLAILVAGYNAGDTEAVTRDEPLQWALDDLEEIKSVCERKRGRR